jgi:hypothetical protein
MAAAHCPQCGGDNPPGAAFCAYCGSPLATGLGAPLPAGTPPAFSPSDAPPSAYAAYPPVPPRPRPVSKIWKIAVIAVALIVVVAVVAILLFPAPSGIQVGTINVWSNDDVCGLNAAYTYGFNASTGASVPLAFNITGAPNAGNNGTLACTIETVVTNTSGFGLTDLNVPLVIPANGNETLNITVLCPGSDYSGDLNLVMT